MGQSPRRTRRPGEGDRRRAQYAADVRLAGMLYAKLLRPARPRREAAQAPTPRPRRSCRASRVVEQRRPDRRAARRPRGRPRPPWPRSAPSGPPAAPGADQDGIFDELLAKAPAREIRETKGEPQRRRARRRAEGLRARPTSRATSPTRPWSPTPPPPTFEDGKLTVWASTQTPFPLRDRLAPHARASTPRTSASSRPSSGAASAARARARQAEEAARLAKTHWAGRCRSPVTRAEEFFYDTFDPASS